MTTIAGRVEARYTVPAGESIAATYNGVGPTAVSLTAGTYYATDYVAHIQARLIAVTGFATWSVTLDTTTGLVSVVWTGAGNWALVWSTLGTRTILGFTIDIPSTLHGVAVAGVKQAIGVWIPNTTLNADVDTKEAPTETDQRDTETATGDVITIAGIDRYVHTNLLWEHVAINRVWIAEEITANQSYERFYLDAIRGNGNTWFTPGSFVRVYDHRGATLGQAHSVTGWKVSGCPNLTALRMSINRYTGLVKVAWPRLVSSG